jgi:hypothetical protein
MLLLFSSLSDVFICLVELVIIDVCGCVVLNFSSDVVVVLSCFCPVVDARFGASISGFPDGARDLFPVPFCCVGVSSLKSCISVMLQ